VTRPKVGSAHLGTYYPASYAAHTPVRRARERLVAALKRAQVAATLTQPPFAALDGSDGGRALDVGCGRGDLAVALRRRGWEVVGIEPSAAACAVARARGIEAHAGTVGDVALPPASLDAAIFRHSLEHVVDPHADLVRVRAALRPGGLVLISVPNFASSQRRRFGSCWYHLDLPRHRMHFTSQGLTRLLERSGLVVDALTRSTSSAGLPASLQYRAFGRCLFPSGTPLRLALLACGVLLPAVHVLDGWLGERDLLHVTARRAGSPPQPSTARTRGAQSPEGRGQERPQVVRGQRVQVAPPLGDRRAPLLR
jgi:SAM-dependent methyltransferase